MSDSLEECIEDANAVVLLANHPEFEQDMLISNPSLPKDAIIYDGWHSLDPTNVCRMGHDYYSPGRFVKKVKS